MDINQYIERDSTKSFAEVVSQREPQIEGHAGRKTRPDHLRSTKKCRRFQ
jgi:hypothetical protein